MVTPQDIIVGVVTITAQICLGLPVLRTLIPSFFGECPITSGILRVSRAHCDSGVTLVSFAGYYLNVVSSLKGTASSLLEFRIGDSDAETDDIADEALGARLVTSLAQRIVSAVAWVPSPSEQIIPIKPRTSIKVK